MVGDGVVAEEVGRERRRVLGVEREGIDMERPTGELVERQRALRRSYEEALLRRERALVVVPPDDRGFPVALIVSRVLSLVGSGGRGLVIALSRSKSNQSPLSGSRCPLQANAASSWPIGHGFPGNRMCPTSAAMGLRFDLALERSCGPCARHGTRRAAMGLRFDLALEPAQI